METVRDFISGGSEITADGNCSLEIKRRLLFGRKVMTNLDSILKSRDSPGWMHETSARTWCTQRDWVEREVGGGIGMGNTCISKADSCQCMTKTTTIL